VNAVPVSSFAHRKGTNKSNRNNESDQRNLFNIIMKEGTKEGRGRERGRESKKAQMNFQGTRLEEGIVVLNPRGG
jgi:hypothetical protein